MRKLYFIIFCLLNPVAYALPSDSIHKIVITADESIYKHQAGVAVFNGHVIAHQGSMTIHADRLVARYNKQYQIDEVTAFGILQPAQLTSLRKIDNSTLEAKAGTILFHPTEPDITLTHAAEIIQGRNRFNGEQIHYNRLNDTVTVPESSNGNAIIIYDTDKNKAAQS